MDKKHSRGRKIEGSTDRVFGCIMATFFSLIALTPLLSGQPIRWWALLIAGLFLVPALIFPRSLSKLNQWWMRLGLLMSAIVSPIAMGIVFFCVITPFGILIKLFGRNLMPLHFDPKTDSYWIPRQPPGPDPKTMKNSF